MNTVATEINLKGLHCNACQKIVEKRLETLPGVEEVEIDLETGAVKIFGNRLVDKDEIMKVLEGTEYQIV